MPEPQPQFLDNAVSVHQRREQFLDRPLPSDENVERCILGYILLDQDLMVQVAEELLPDDFYSPLNRRIYSAMLTLYAEAKTVEPILIGAELKKSGSLEAIGGISTILSLTHGLLIGISDLSQYIKIVQDKKKLRDLIRACNQITAAALEEEEDTEIILDRAEQTIFDLTNQPKASKPEMINTLAAASVTRTENLMENPRSVVGIPTGLKDLDDATGGWRKGNLIILAARPSMGKSALMLQMAKAGVDDGQRVGLIFSLEMPKDDLIDRLICSEAKTDLFDYQKGTILPYQLQQTVSALRQAIPGRRLFIDDRPGITSMQILSTARRLAVEQKRLDFIMVDYLQMMTGTGRTRGENRVQEVSSISSDLKTIAKILEIPVIALSQLSRAPEARNPPKPMMSDLRESGAIEQDADVVAFIYREEYYKPTDENFGRAEILLRKHRNGPTCDIQLAFLKQFARFEDCYDEDQGRR